MIRWEKIISYHLENEVEVKEKRINYNHMETPQGT